jgi:hypothetical protein
VDGAAQGVEERHEEAEVAVLLLVVQAQVPEVSKPRMISLSLADIRLNQHMHGIH